jgi:tRNA 2-thiouridine synthesizing protein A
MFALTLRADARTWSGGGHDGGREAVFAGGDELMSGRRARLFGRAPSASPAPSARPAPDQQAAGTGPVPLTEAERATVPASAPVAALTINALGRKCPIPIIMLAEQIRDVPLGAVVAVLADDPAAYTDIPSWCMMKAHEFAGHQELPQGGWALYIRRTL